MGSESSLAEQMPVYTATAFLALFSDIINITLNLCLVFGLALKSVVFALGPPSECVFVAAFFTFLATVLSDTAFDRITWAFVQGWWSLVKLTRSALGIKKNFTY